jgi:hypothetical protein
MRDHFYSSTTQTRTCKTQNTINKYQKVSTTMIAVVHFAPPPDTFVKRRRIMNSRPKPILSSRMKRRRPIPEENSSERLKWTFTTGVASVELFFAWLPVGLQRMQYILAGTVKKVLLSDIHFFQLGRKKICLFRASVVYQFAYKWGNQLNFQVKFP